GTAGGGSAGRGTIGTGGVASTGGIIGTGGFTSTGGAGGRGLGGLGGISLGLGGLGGISLSLGGRGGIIGGGGVTSTGGRVGTGGVTSTGGNSGVGGYSCDFLQVNGDFENGMTGWMATAPNNSAVIYHRGDPALMGVQPASGDNLVVLGSAGPGDY